MSLENAKVKVTPKVTPSTQVFATNDSFENFTTRLGVGPQQQNGLSGGVYAFNFVTRNRTLLEAAYRGSWVVGNVIDCIAEDMTRAGIDVSTNEGLEDLKDLDSNISRLQVWQSLADVIKWGRLYGGSIGVMQIEGQNSSTALNVATVGKGQFLGLAVYDRWQLNPVMNSMIKFGPDIGLPEYYDIVNNPATSTQSTPGPQGTTNPDGTLNQTGTMRVHYSRVVRYVGIKLPYFQAITEMMWGESNLERLWDRLISFDNATMSSANLIDRANLRTVQIESLRDIIGAGGEALKGLVAQFEMMRELQNNEGLTLLDAKDVFSSTSFSFAGLSDMMLQFGQQLSGASGIPLVRLFGQSPAGLSSTGENDMRMYYDNINTQQEARLRNPMETLLKVLWRSTFGKDAPKDMTFKFTPLWQMSDTDKAQNAKTVTETIEGAYTGGLINLVTALKELKDSSKETGLFTNITDEDIANAQNDEPPMPDVDPANPDVDNHPAIKAFGGEGSPDDHATVKAHAFGEDEKPAMSAFEKIKAFLGMGKKPKQTDHEKIKAHAEGTTDDLVNPKSQLENADPKKHPPLTDAMKIKKWLAKQK